MAAFLNAFLLNCVSQHCDDIDEVSLQHFLLFFKYQFMFFATSDIFMNFVLRLIEVLLKTRSFFHLLFSTYFYVPKSNV